MVAKRDPKVQMSAAYMAEARRTRRPSHKFNIRSRPYQLQPIMLAPVLPGETMTNIMVMSQCWSDPLKASMKNIGWWLHYNFFYVRLRDLPEEIRDRMAAMMLDPEQSLADMASPEAVRPTYTYAGGIDWLQMCLEHITEEYFRDEGEPWDIATAEGLPLCKVYGQGQEDPFKRLTLASEYEDRRVDLDVDQDGKITVDEVQRAMAHHAAMRDHGLTDMDFEDYMRTYGSKVREDENSPNLHKAEDLWSVRDFTYPTNTVDPTTGLPSVAVGWRVSQHGAKKIFCDEPGFLVGVQYVRPKIYLRNQKGSIAGAMQDMRAWLPAILHGEHDVSHLLQDAGEGPLAGSFGEGYWLDLADLLIHGDQLVNYDPAGQPAFLNLPDAGANRRYAAEAEISQFFIDAGGKFETDGVVNLSILGRQRERQKSLVLGRQ